jgi:hypothetical protein
MNADRPESPPCSTVPTTFDPVGQSGRFTDLILGLLDGWRGPNKPLLPTQARCARPGGRPAGRWEDAWHVERSTWMNLVGDGLLLVTDLICG